MSHLSLFVIPTCFALMALICAAISRISGFSGESLLSFTYGSISGILVFILVAIVTSEVPQ